MDPDFIPSHFIIYNNCSNKSFETNKTPKETTKETLEKIKSKLNSLQKQK
jgi:hypothetical protein